MENRTYYRSLDHVNWWDPDRWKSRIPRSLSSVSLTGADPAEIRNGWLTLTDHKARYQKKQMQEREMKIASLYEAQQARALDRVRHSPSNKSSNGTNGVSTVSSQVDARDLSIPHHPGKVRQMFEERRTKAGIDKSYPLQPIVNTDRTRKVNTITSKTTATSRVVEKKSKVERGAVKTHSVKRQVIKTENIVNGSGDINHNREPEKNVVKMLPHSNGEHVSVDVGVDETDHDNNYLIENETFPENLAPEPTPRSPAPREPTPEPKRPPRRSPVKKPSPPTVVKKSTPPVAPTRSSASDNTVSEGQKPRGGMQRPVASAIKKSSHTSASSSKPASRGRVVAGVPSASSANANAEGVPCAVCGRRFAPDRLEKHQSICKRTTTKKRKPFDALKHRLAGTEAEPFINKLRKQGTASQTKVKPLNNTWRQKHNEFINAIRAAKQVQAHLNAGGKLSDLPPPPPSENPDYVQCPHCQRRFNQGAAERHIPKCANYSFNKPKPGQAPARKR